MGDIARLGIVDGRKVALSEVDRVTRTSVPLDQFSQQCLEYYGFVEIADKVLQAQVLNVLEITRLLRDAPLPLLMKLVQLKCGELLYCDPVPVVALPLRQWTSEVDELYAYERAVEFLADLPYSQLWVVVDDFNPMKFDKDFVSLLKDILRSRSGLDLIGPRPEAILGWVGEEKQPGNKSVEFGKLIEVLNRMKVAGFKRLRPTSRLELVKLMHGIGVPTGLTTYVDRFASDEELAFELYHIGELARNEGVIDLWIPGLSSRSTELHLRGTQDHIILRLMAVGTLVLEGVPWRRALSRYLSIDAMQMAQLFGANEFGVSAVDAFTANSFRLLLSKRFESLPVAK